MAYSIFTWANKISFSFSIFDIPYYIPCFLFGNIYNLSRLNGYCFATNKVLSNLSFVKIRTINYSLKRLKEKGYINVERIKNDVLIQRRIYVNDMQDDSG